MTTTVGAVGGGTSFTGLNSYGTYFSFQRVASNMKLYSNWLITPHV